MRIDTSGNVGIGTSTPATKLTIATAANTGVLVSSTDGTTFKGIAFNTSDNQFTVGTQTNHPLAFFSNNTERARIDSSGNLIQSAPSTAPSLTANGQMVFNLTSDTNLRVSVRGSDGVTRTANITLA